MTDTTESEAPLDRWKFRRRMVIAAVLFFAVLLAWLVVFGNPANGLHMLVAGNVGWWLLGVIGVYIGAPVADDWLQKNKGTPR